MAATVFAVNVTFAYTSFAGDHLAVLAEPRWRERHREHLGGAQRSGREAGHVEHVAEGGDAYVVFAVERERLVPGAAVPQRHHLRSRCAKAQTREAKHLRRGLAVPKLAASCPIEHAAAELRLALDTRREGDTWLRLQGVVRRKAEHARGRGNAAGREGDGDAPGLSVGEDPVQGSRGRLCTEDSFTTAALDGEARHLEADPALRRHLEHARHGGTGERCAEIELRGRQSDPGYLSLRAVDPVATGDQHRDHGHQITK
jgi:hypothetical protein